MIRIGLLALFLFSQISQAEIVRFSQVDQGVFRGGQPETHKDYVALKTMGIKTILNLRTHDDTVDPERAEANELGIGFINIGLNSFFPPTDRDINHALSILTDAALQPIFFHCQHGKDRTGLVAGIYRVEVQKWNKDRAWTEMKEIGFEPLLLGLNHYFWVRSDEDKDE
ncbi:MAG: tyrosine-protein phosphatase [Bdellovibrionota bacterium]